MLNLEKQNMTETPLRESDWIDHVIYRRGEMPTGMFRVCFSMSYYCFTDGVLRD